MERCSRAEPDGLGPGSLGAPPAACRTKLRKRSVRSKGEKHAKRCKAVQKLCFWQAVGMGESGPVIVPVGPQNFTKPSGGPEAQRPKNKLDECVPDPCFPGRMPSWSPPRSPGGLMARCLVEMPGGCGVMAMEAFLLYRVDEE